MPGPDAVEPGFAGNWSGGKDRFAYDEVKRGRSMGKKVKQSVLGVEAWARPGSFFLGRPSSLLSFVIDKE